MKDSHTNPVPRSLSLLSALAIALAFFAGTAAALAEARPATLVKDIYPGAPASLDTTTQYFTIVGSQLYFVADDGTHGAELWKSDGTEIETVLVKDLATAITETLVPGPLVAFDGRLFFNGDEGINGAELWVSDGTEPGTYLLKDIRPGDSSNPQRFQVSGGTLFFTASDGSNGVELWKTDGSNVGTAQVEDINPSGASSPAQLTDVAGTLYFVADDGTYGNELWKSDGTADGTLLVEDIFPGNAGSDPRPLDLVNLNGELLFTADDGTNGRALWRSDGTEPGTYMVKDINPTSTPSFNPDKLTVAGDTVFFTAGDATNGLELWKSDGTEVGTVLVRDIVSGSGGSQPNFLTAAGGVLYFTAVDGTNGRELWRSDGTEAGTMMVKDIYPGTTGSSPSNLAFIDNVLYFSADDGVHGKELWRSAGTEADTFLLSDIHPTGSSEPVQIRGLGTLLLFSADDGTHGRELWLVDLTNDVPTVSAGGPYSGNEGSAIALNGSVNDADGDSLTHLWMVNSSLCTIGDATQLATSVTCTDNGSFLVTLTVTDAFGAVDADTTSLTVNNVAPVIQSVNGPSMTAGYVALTITFNDPGSNDTHAYEIDWGDGPPVQGNIPPGATQFTVNHSYTTGGVYSIGIEVSDDDGGMDSTTHEVTVEEEFSVYLPVLLKP